MLRPPAAEVRRRFEVLPIDEYWEVYDPFSDEAPVVVITAHGTIDTAVEAMRRGAYDFVTKPVNLDRLEMLVRRALRERAMQAENV